MNSAGLFTTERGFVADITILAQLPDVAEISIAAAYLRQTDHLMGENHQRPRVLLGRPALQKGRIYTDVSAADSGIAGNALKETM